MSDNSTQNSSNPYLPPQPGPQQSFPAEAVQPTTPPPFPAGHATTPAAPQQIPPVPPAAPAGAIPGYPGSAQPVHPIPAAPAGQPYPAAPAYPSAPTYSAPAAPVYQAPAAPGYPAPAYPAYAAARPTNGLALATLICGIAGIVFSWLIFAIIVPIFISLAAVVMGHISLSQIKRNPALGGRGMALTGLILGYVPIAISIILLLFGILAIVAFGAFSVPFLTS
ncbi:DUF4190 domain-containing protein [Microbacterium sp. NPDC055903]